MESHIDAGKVIARLSGEIAAAVQRAVVAEVALAEAQAQIENLTDTGASDADVE